MATANKLNTLAYKPDNKNTVNPIGTASPNVPAPVQTSQQAYKTSIPKPATVPPVTDTSSFSKSSYPSIPKDTTVPPVQDTSSFTNSNYPALPSSFAKASIPTPPPKETTFSNPQYADWLTTQNQNYANLEKMMNTPFTYDPNTDATLQSQKALYEAGAAKASQSALESMNERGIMNSTLTGSQLAQIQQDANTQFNALIPQYQQQAYNQYQDRLSNAGQLLANSMNLRNNQFNEGITEANLTGSYLPPGAQQIVNQLLSLKGQAETKGVTAEQRAGYSAEADKLRTQLQAMGVDISGLGANTSLANSQVGQRTLAGQQLDANKESDLRNYNEGVRQYDTNLSEDQRQFNASLAEQIRQYDSNLDYTKIRDAVSDEQWAKQFDEQVRQFGMNNALDWAANSIAQQNANTNSGQLSLAQSKFAYDKSQPKSSGSSSSPKDAKYDYNSDPGYSETLQELYQNPSVALADLKRDPAYFRDLYGAKGYNELLGIAEKEVKNSSK